MKTLNTEEQAKVQHVIESGIKVKQEVKDLSEGLRDTVKAVKDKALGGEFSKESPCYKLILARSSSELIDQKTLEEENVQDDGKCRISYQDV